MCTGILVYYSLVVQCTSIHRSQQTCQNPKPRTHSSRHSHPSIVYRLYIHHSSFIHAQTLEVSLVSLDSGHQLPACCEHFNPHPFSLKAVFLFLVACHTRETNLENEWCQAPTQTTAWRFVWRTCHGMWGPTTTATISQRMMTEDHPARSTSRNHGVQWPLVSFVFAGRWPLALDRRVVLTRWPWLILIPHICIAAQ